MDTLIMERVPTQKLYWVNQKRFNLDNYYKDKEKGCFLKVGKYFYDQLHDIRSRVTK